MVATIQYYPDKQVDNIQGWHWIATDSGAWDGPKQDWEESHRHHIISTQESTGKQFRTVVQAGGNQGMYPRLLSQMFETVYTFEPDTLNFATLVLNTPVDNVVKMQCGLGGRMGTCTVYQHTMQNTGMHTVVEGGRVPLIPLDVLQLSNVDLIMLDLEGYEFEAIQGALNTIRTWMPVIFAERPTEQLVVFLQNQGYTCLGLSKMDGVFVPSC